MRNLPSAFDPCPEQAVGSSGAAPGTHRVIRSVCVENGTRGEAIDSNLTDSFRLISENCSNYDRHADAQLNVDLRLSNYACTLYSDEGGGQFFY